jgi:tripartite-type tricarboxylate transporter receptor subunit TctC
MFRTHDRRGGGTRVIAALALLTAVSVFALAPSTKSRAADAGAWLKGQTVHFVVGYSAGGGYDTYARMLAPFFEKHTGATVVVENKPGGGGMTATNQLVRGKPDGLTMQVLNGESAIMWQLVGETGVAYDMSKVSILAGIQHEPHFVLVNPKLPDSLKEILASGKKIKFVATRRVDNLGDYAAVLCEALKMNCQIITGYKGSKGASLAMMSGEADALAISESSGLHYAAGGRSKIIATIGHERSEFEPKIPTVYEMFPKMTAAQWWPIDTRLKAKTTGRCLIGPPGIPAAHLAYLQKVWKDVLTDPAVIAQGKKIKHEVHYSPPQQLQGAIKELLQDMSQSDRQRMKEILTKKFSS